MANFNFAYDLFEFAPVESDSENAVPLWGVVAGCPFNIGLRLATVAATSGSA